jgi:branched-subunit amino acid aminotransferase/4-amino-4-deoxychorismate lyase
MIPDDDRGFRLGDGLFETVLAVAGELKLWDAHMARMGRGCAALGLPAPEPATCRAAAKTALGDLPRASVRLSWSAGSGGRAVDRPETLSPRLVVTATANTAPAGPLSLRLVSVRRNEGSPASRLKTLAYLDNVLARREARAAGADEAVMLNNRGELACAAAGNLFWLRGRTLLTPALECGVLDGTIRALLMERAGVAGWSVQEVRAGPEALSDADAVFVTSSGIGVCPAGALDGAAFESHGAWSALPALVADAC